MLSHLASSASMEDAFLQKEVAFFDLQYLHSVCLAWSLHLLGCKYTYEKAKLC